MFSCNSDVKIILLIWIQNLINTISWELCYPERLKVFFIDSFNPFSHLTLSNYTPSSSSSYYFVNFKKNGFASCYFDHSGVIHRVYVLCSTLYFFRFQSYMLSILPLLMLWKSMLQILCLQFGRLFLILSL